MSRKKLRLDRRIEVLSRDPAHSVSLPLKMFGLLLLSILVSFLGCWWQRIECARRGKQDECQPWFYPRLVAYRYFWLSEGA